MSAVLWCLKEGEGSESKVSDKEVDESRSDEEAWVRCANCLSILTSGDEKTRVNDASRHRCMNPHGLFFHVECFRLAAGTFVRGTPEGFWSWFTGYQWQISECRGCGQHVGWFFSREGHSFFGLIVDRISSGS